MENTSTVEINELKASLAQHLDNEQTEIAGLYQKALRETLFTNRSDVRPRMLRDIAANEVEALKNYFRQVLAPDMHGAELCEIGLSEQSVLRLIQVTRQYFLLQSGNSPRHTILEIIDTYQNQVLHGFVKRFEEIILMEQEQIRSALQIAISRYTIEIREVQELAQRATEASEFKSRFMARISHELRTPLGAILGMADMLQYDVYGPLTPAQEDITKRIVKNALMLEQIFSELLDQSQIESGQLRLKEESFSPQKAVQTVHSSCLSMALDKGVALSHNIDANLPQSVIGDRIRIEQILSNLVVNAIKFTEIGYIDIHAYRNGETWGFRVQDTGIGISPADQAQIFEPFRQVDNTLRSEYGGVGLGLAIVKQLVSAMDGTISLESKLGQGSTFTVVLPLRVSK